MRWVTIDGVTKCLNSAGVSRWLAALSLMFLLHAPGVSAREVIFVWDANSEPVLGGYRLYYGPASKTYTSVIDVGNQTTFTVFGLVDDRIYCFAVTAYDITKTLESTFSNEVAVLPTTLTVIDGSPSAEPSDNDVALVADWMCG